MTPPRVLILGASSGIGAATATAFARRGHPVYGVHFDLRAARPRVDALRASLEAFGGEVHLHNGNAIDPEQRATVLADLEARGPVGVLVHSLAFGTLRPVFAESKPLSDRQLAMTMDVMAHSLLWWTRDLVDRGLLGAGGRIVALTSAGSLVAWPAYAAVSSAKAALESHIRQLAVELAPRGITANAIMAGVTHTPALEKIPDWERLVADGQRRNPHGRITTPEDVAEAITALTRPETAWMTGNVIRVDGGETIAG